MSKKTENLAQQATGEKPVEKEIVHVTPLYRTCSVGMIYPFQQSLPRVVVFPPNRTDQMHGATVAQMVKQGQGNVLEEDLNNFDFKAGQKDDGSLKAHSLYEMEWSDPAERYETEQKLHTEIVTAIRREAHDKAMAMAQERSEAQQTASQQQDAVAESK